MRNSLPVRVFGADGCRGGAWVVADHTEGEPPRLWLAPSTQALLEVADEAGAEGLPMRIVV